MRGRGFTTAYAEIGLLIAWGNNAYASEGLSECAASFPGDNVGASPHVDGTSAGTPSGNDLQLCFYSADTPFFALEYDPDRREALWVAYRLTKTFGADKCGSLPRDMMGCYFKREDVQACFDELADGGDSPGDKRGRGQSWWSGKPIPSDWSVRDECSGGFEPQAYFPDISMGDRVKLCASDEFNTPL